MEFDGHINQEMLRLDFYAEQEERKDIEKQRKQNDTQTSSNSGGGKYTSVKLSPRMMREIKDEQN